MGWGKVTSAFMWHHVNETLLNPKSGCSLDSRNKSTRFSTATTVFCTEARHHTLARVAVGGIAHELVSSCAGEGAGVDGKRGAGLGAGHGGRGVLSVGNGRALGAGRPCAGLGREGWGAEVACGVMAR